jgi:hypothetical protein
MGSYEAYPALVVRIAAIIPPLALRRGEAGLVKGEAGHGFEEGRKVGLRLLYELLRGLKATL